MFLAVLFFSWLMMSCSTAENFTPEMSDVEMEIPEDQPKVLIIAHRGARSLAPENTIPAAVKAFENHADGWELDVAMSRDGVLVVVHDDTLERTSDVKEVFPDRQPWSVYDFTLAELQQLDFGSWFVATDPFEQIDAGIISPEDVGIYQGVTIPTLQKALLYTKSNHWWVNIEIKNAAGTAADGVIVQKVVDLVMELEMEEQVLISSFNFEYLQQVKDLNKDLATGVLVNKVVVDPISLMERLDAQAFHPGIKVTYPGQVALLRQHGYDVNVWTVNEVHQMQDLIEMGVTGIITDFPQRLYQVLND